MAKMYVREVKDPFAKAKEIKKFNNKRLLYKAVLISSLAANLAFLAHLLLK